LNKLIFTQNKIEENLPNVNKQSIQTRGKERYKMDGPKSKRKEKTTNEGGPKGE
jgi:hypothetical protein